MVYVQQETALNAPWMWWTHGDPWCCITARPVQVPALALFQMIVIRKLKLSARSSLKLNTLLLNFTAMAIIRLSVDAPVVE